MKKKIHTPKKKVHHAASIPKPTKIPKTIDTPMDWDAQITNPSKPVPQPAVPEPEPQQSPAQQMHHRIVKS